MEDLIIKCPACKTGIISIEQRELEIAHFGEIMVSTLTCGLCGYRSSDVIPLSQHPPRRYSVRIRSKDELNIRVVRSGSSVVRIPEIGARIDPGTFSEGYITNVEGILLRFRDILDHMERDISSRQGPSDLTEQISRTKELKGLINNTIEGEGLETVLTLIIEDPLGNSAIIDDGSGSVTVKDLDQDEIGELLSFNAQLDD